MTAKTTPVRKRGVRRRRPGWDKQQAKKKEETSQILENENVKELSVKEAIPPPASIITPKEIETAIPKTYPIGSHRDNAIIIHDEKEVLRALTIFFQTPNPNDIFIKRETMTKHNGHSFKVVSAEGPKGKQVQLWFDVTSLAIVL